MTIAIYLNLVESVLSIAVRIAMGLVKAYEGKKYKLRIFNVV